MLNLDCLQKNMTQQGISILDDHEYTFSILLQLATCSSQLDKAGKVLILSTTSKKFDNRLNFL